jgi:iron(III) transport system ATP-binding protein
MTLEIKNVRKAFGNFVALKDINLDVGEKEFVCLLGPSGCGKTTLLRIVAGLLPFEGGNIILGGQALDSTPARDRNFGIVFQSYSLFPNMTALQNVGYGLKLRGMDAQAVSKQAKQFLEMVKMPHLAERYPHELSGGQQQRVAIARALAAEPALLLLDEPLSALDARVRTSMRAEIREMQQDLGIPTIMVTHDQEEALTMADRVVCMNQGEIVQVDTPINLYQRPKTHFVADFVGLSNFLPPSWVRDFLPNRMDDLNGADADAHEFAFRPEQVSLKKSPKGSGTVKDIVFLGNISRVTLDIAQQDVVAEVAGAGAFQAGDRVELSLDGNSGSWVLT